MEFFNLTLVPQQIVDAIGRTLFHSLWQGLVLTGITGLIVILTQAQKPTVRYNLLIVTMLTFFISTVVTFINVLANIVDSAGLNASNAVNITTELSTKSISLADTTLLSQVSSYFNSNSGTLVFIWFLIVSTRSLQLVIGLNRLKYLRSTAIFDKNGVWGNKVKDLAQQLGIKQAIGFAESSLAKVPMVIGNLKPLILLPIGLLTALPAKEVEAILIHELAHIYRRDYLVNMLQSLMGILFFFNPAVLWLSGLIKVERENCCDDIAVNLTSSKMNYINALVSCQEYQLALPAYAMAFSKKGQLKSRVARLIHNHNQSLNGLEKSIIVICIISVASLGLMAISNEAKINRVVKRTTTSLHTTMMDMKNDLTTNQDSLKPLGALQQLSIQTNALNQAICPPESKNNANQLNGGTQKEFAKSYSNQQRLSNEQAYFDSLQVLNDLKKIDAEKMRLDGLAQLNENKALVNKAKAVADHVKWARVDSIRQSLKTLNDTIKSTRIDNKLSPLKAKLSMPVQSVKSSPVKLDLSDVIEQALRNDGLLSESDSRFSFMLSKQDLIVNGKRQPEAIHKKYKEKYIPVGNNSWSLYRDYNSSKRTVVTKELDLAFNFNQEHPIDWHYDA